jgi:hypothetical protein
MSNYTPGTNIGFSFEYAVSLIVVLVVCNLLVCNLLVKNNPAMNMVIVILAGLVVGYISLLLLNNVFPYLNNIAYSIYQYFAYEVLNNFNSMGYIHLWPPILAVLIIFIILLYNKNLG